MKKNYIFGIAAALMMGTVALSSCSSEELTVKNEVQQAEVAKTYSFSIPATMDDGAGTRVFDIGESTITSAFVEGVEVWVFIEDGEGRIAYGKDPLTPQNVSEDGSTCTFEANGLTFISNEPGFEPALGDEVYLYYGMTADPSNPLDGYFDFAMNDGSKVGAESMDYNLAKMVITHIDDGTGTLTFGQENDLENTTFSFTNINSIFRQKLTFKKGSFTVTPTISSIVINTEYGVVHSYYPFYSGSEYGPITITSPDDEGNIYFSSFFGGFNEFDPITFTAVDEDGYTYTCTKAAPEGGFENNKYYYGEATLVKGLPIIIGANFVEASGAVLSIEDDPFNFTISGNSEDYMFDMGTAEGSITLDNVTATNSQDNGFLYGTDASLKLTLTGDNSITCKTGQFCIAVKELELSCTGSSATLTLTHVYDYTSLGGIYSDAYNTQNGDLSALAADGFTVTRSSPTENEDGTYTWTYTVTKD